jgi:hypothetical protein
MLTLLPLFPPLSPLHLDLRMILSEMEMMMMEVVIGVGVVKNLWDGKGEALRTPLRYLLLNRTHLW